MDTEKWRIAIPSTANQVFHAFLLFYAKMRLHWELNRRGVGKLAQYRHSVRGLEKPYVKEGFISIFLPENEEFPFNS